MQRFLGLIWLEALKIDLGEISEQILVAAYQAVECTDPSSRSVGDGHQACQKIQYEESASARDLYALSQDRY